MKSINERERDREILLIGGMNAPPIFMKIGLEIHNFSKEIVCGFSPSMAVRLLISIVAFLISCGGAVIRLEEVYHVERGRCNWRGRGSIAAA